MRTDILRAGLASAALLALAACQPEQPAADANTAETTADTSLTSDVLAVLVDFEPATEGHAEMFTESAAAELVGTDDEGKALALRFVPEADAQAVAFRFDPALDWSGYDGFNIAFDARNPGDESVHLFLSLTDTMGATIYHSASLPAGGGGSYYAVVNGPSRKVDTGLRDNPPPWEGEEEKLIYMWQRGELDIGAIEEVRFFVSGTIAEKQLLLDNVRLRRNPDHDPAYLEGLVDEFGQNARTDYPLKVHSLEELQQAAREELAALDASGPLPDRSRFGGWKDGPRLEATGYFRTEKVDGKWWLVDPDGYLFFSNGLANVRIANLTTLTGVDFRDPSVRYVDPSEVTPEDSIGIVQVSDEARQTRYVSLPVRHGMFTWLPEYNHELANHYSFRRSAHRGPIDGGETFSFYRANLERRYGETGPESFLRKWEEVTLARMLDWGFTSMGNWVDPAFYPNEQLPYFANGWIIGEFKTLASPLPVWAPMPDSFDPEFVRRADVTIEVIADEIQDSPWCVGVFVDNEKSWGLREGTVPERYGLILDALSREAIESPAKRAFTVRLQETYGDIALLNARWNTSLASWDELAAGVEFTDYSEGAVADLSMLLEMLSEQYFRVVHEALEKHLPNHLYMGVRMATWGMPDETVKAAVRYSDVLSFNIYEEGLREEEWAFLGEIDLPAIIGEWHIGATSDTGLFHPGLIYAANQADRAAMWRVYMDSVLAHPNFIGAHWFQYVDSPITGRAFDGENYNVGFVSTTDIPYPEMVAAAKSFHASMYPRRFEQEVGPDDAQAHD